MDNIGELTRKLVSELPENHDLTNKTVVAIFDGTRNDTLLLTIDLKQLLIYSIKSALKANGVIGKDYFKGINPNVEDIIIEVKEESICLRIKRTKEARNAFKNGMKDYTKND